MNTNLQPYPVYKPSGLEWLASIPAHWRTERSKWLFKKMKRPVRDTDDVVTCFRDGVVTRRKNRRTEGFTESIQEIGCQGIRAGDLVIHAMDAFAGAIGVADSDGKGTPVYSVCRPEPHVNAYFFAYILREMARSQWIAALATGIRERSTDFRYATLASQQLPLPPLPEQHAIARYLDHIDRRIQRYIQAKEKRITLLHEARQATIHRAVTRGLDPDVPLKPSDVEWLGDVPAHWGVRRLKSICRFAYGDSLPAEARTSGIVSVYGSNGTVGSHSFSNTNGPCLIIGRKGSFGKVHYSSESAFAIDTTFYVDRRNTDADIRWLYYLLNSLHLDAISKDSAVPGLNREDAYRQIGPYPPLAEQTAIAAHLDNATAAIAAAIDAARRQTEQMQEYRASLIAHVVTGKLDVRAAAERISMATS